MHGKGWTVSGEQNVLILFGSLPIPRSVRSLCRYFSKRCVYIAELTDLTYMRRVPGLKSNSGYSAVRFARSIVFQEWPSSQKTFADTEEDWAKWRVMGGDLNVIKALGIGDFILSADSRMGM